MSRQRRAVMIIATVICLLSVVGAAFYLLQNATPESPPLLVLFVAVVLVGVVGLGFFVLSAALDQNPTDSHEWEDWESDNDEDENQLYQ